MTDAAPDQRAGALTVPGLMATILHEVNTPLQYITDSLLLLQEALAEARPGATPVAAGSGVIDERVPRALERALEGVSAIRDAVQTLAERSRSEESD